MRINRRLRKVKRRRRAWPYVLTPSCIAVIVLKGGAKEAFTSILLMMCGEEVLLAVLEPFSGVFVYIQFLSWGGSPFSSLFFEKKGREGLRGSPRLCRVCAEFDFVTGEGTCAPVLYWSRHFSPYLISSCVHPHLHIALSFCPLLLMYSGHYGIKVLYHTSVCFLYIVIDLLMLAKFYWELESLLGSCRPVSMV